MKTIEKLQKATPLWVGKFAAIFVPLIAAVAGGASPAVAQTESVLYSFAGGTSDGANPYAGLAIDGSGNLYGATYSGGSYGQGVVFEFASGATSDTVLCNLPGGAGGVNGAGPTGTPLLSGSNIYGTAVYNSVSSGAGSGGGVIYELKPNGSGGYNYSVLHNFAGGSTDGENPFSGVVIDSSSNLYGTTSSGGGSGDGTVYKQPVSGTFSLLHKFTGGSGDGQNPYATLLLSGSDLWGTTVEGGSSDNGFLYEQPVSGGSFAYSRSLTTSSNGIFPRGGLVRDSSGNLYGTTWFGGNVADDGVVFKLTPNGSGGYTYSVIYTFNGGSTDGANPYASLIFDSTYTNLYGTTTSGGASGYGTVFELSPKVGGGYNETILHSFAGGSSDGANPYAALVFDSTYTHLYGTTLNGGASGKGVIFKITP